MNVQKQIDYWRTGADEDIAAAGSLLEKGHPRHALFFAHLAVEKMLKAHVTGATGDVPPRTHDLLHLVGLAGVQMSSERLEFLGNVQRWCIEGRYPESWPPVPTMREADSGLKEAREVLGWLGKLLR